MGYMKDILLECDNNVDRAKELLKRRTDKVIAYEQWLASLPDDERARYLGNEPDNFDRLKLEIEET